MNRRAFLGGVAAAIGAGPAALTAAGAPIAGAIGIDLVETSRHIILWQSTPTIWDSVAARGFDCDEIANIFGAPPRFFVWPDK